MEGTKAKAIRKIKRYIETLHERKKVGEDCHCVITFRKMSL